jgi:hypothetical protein
MMIKQCIACGMPMQGKKDYAAGDEKRDYCVHCARPDGSMRSYEETLAGMTRFMVTTQGIEENAAREVVRGLMANLPAWQARKK